MEKRAKVRVYLTKSDNGPHTTYFFVRVRGKHALGPGEKVPLKQSAFEGLTPESEVIAVLDDIQQEVYLRIKNGERKHAGARQRTFLFMGKFLEFMVACHHMKNDLTTGLVMLGYGESGQKKWAEQGPKKRGVAFAELTKANATYFFATMITKVLSDMLADLHSSVRQ